MVTYTDPTAGDDAVAIEDAAGNEAATFTTGRSGVPVVTNNSTVDTTPPTLTERHGCLNRTVCQDRSISEAYEVLSRTCLQSNQFANTLAAAVHGHCRRQRRRRSR